MKKVKFLAMMLAAGMFAACSDALEDSGMDNGGGNNTPATGEGYVKVAINMPTTNGAVTKADDSNILDDGLEDEYAVSSGIIVFFKDDKGAQGAEPTDPDANAKFVKAYTLEGLTQQDDQTDDQISTRVTSTTEAPLVEDDEQLYALVILNPNGAVVSVNQTTGVLTVGGTDLAVGTSTLATLQSKLQNQTLTHYTGESYNAFMMVNAPLSTLTGNVDLTNAKAKTLVPVTVYETEEAAEADTDPARIYVERIVAKVTLSGFTYSNSEYTKVATVSTSAPDGDDESVYNGDVIELTGWTLNVTNNSTKLVRDVTGFSSTDWLNTANSNNASRFVGTNTIAMADNKTYYRIYWAIDGNYTGVNTTVATDFTTYTSTIPPATWEEDAEHDAESHPLYCLENTMDYNQQVENRTTSVLLKTEYRVKFYDNETPSARDFFICGTAPIKYPVNDITVPSSDPAQTIKGIANHVKETAFGSTSAPDLQLKDDADGRIYESAAEMKDLFKIGESTELTDEQAETIWNAIGTIKYYKGGVSYYYAALIRHFDDNEADWNTGDTHSLNHLGRYGVVRNNWYEINVQSISGPGDPEIVTPGDESDDDTEGYIRAEINVLSWAKRQQGVDL